MLAGSLLATSLLNFTENRNNMSENIINDMGFEMKKNPDEQSASETSSNEMNSVNENDTPKDNNSAETTLETVANITLGIGIIASVVMLFTICFIQNPEYHYHKELMFNPTGFATTCGTLLSTLAAWASMKVLANISYTLKAIKNKKQ